MRAFLRNFISGVSPESSGLQLAESMEVRHRRCTRCGVDLTDDLVMRIKDRSGFEYIDTKYVNEGVCVKDGVPVGYHRIEGGGL